MTLEEFEKMATEVEAKTDFIVSWKAIKYNKTIFKIYSWGGCSAFRTADHRSAHSRHQSAGKIPSSTVFALDQQYICTRETLRPYDSKSQPKAVSTCTSRL